MKQDKKSITKIVEQIQNENPKTEIKKEEKDQTKCNIVLSLP